MDWLVKVLLRVRIISNGTLGFGRGLKYNL